MSIAGLRLPPKILMTQKAMLRVSYALIPLAGASVYLFGWRSAALLALILACGYAAEALFTFREAKPVTSAVLVSCLIFHLSLPPTIPFAMAALGIVVGIVFGKMVFGGFGRNIFNPAMVGRCFIYINFPYELTGRWVEPFWGGWGGLAHWSQPLDALTRATPLMQLAEGIKVPLERLVLGNVSGSLGETSVLIIAAGGLWLLYNKTANWRLALPCVLGGLLTSAILMASDIPGAPSPLTTLVSGSFLFGAMFVVTEPISGPKTPQGPWAYGLIIGSLTVVLRVFSNFAEGMMFSVLIMNAFTPLMDQSVKFLKANREAAS